MRPQQAPVSGKVFIQRDYSSGTRCQFQTKFPAELENRGHTHGIWKFPGWGSNRSCCCWPMPEPQQCQIQASSVTYTTAHGNPDP